MFVKSTASLFSPLTLLLVYVPQAGWILRFLFRSSKYVRIYIYLFPLSFTNSFHQPSWPFQAPGSPARMQGMFKESKLRPLPSDLCSHRVRTSSRLLIQLSNPFCPLFMDVMPVEPKKRENVYGLAPMAHRRLTSNA
jgi:hypothetical protein